MNNTFYWISLLIYMLLTSNTVLCEDRVPDAAWGITVETSKHQKTSLARFKGKTLWVDFWASWCAPCHQSFPWLKQLQRSLASYNFSVVAISVDENPDDANAFLKRYQPNFPILLDTKGRLAEVFQLEGMPSGFLIAPDGKILLRHTGFRLDETSSLTQQIRTAVYGVQP